MKTLKLTLVLTLFLLLLACSEDSSTSPEKSVSLNGHTYKNEIIGFEISAPQDWQLEMNKEINGMQALLIGTKSNYSGMAPSFNLISSDANGMKTSSELLAASETYITTNFPDLTIESSKTMNVGGYDCGELVYSFSYYGVNLKQKQLLFLCGTKISVAVTFTAGKYSYESAVPDFDTIINSLKML